MAVSFNSTANSGSTFVNVASYNVASSCVGARCGVVFVGTLASATPIATGASWGGTAMTEVPSSAAIDTTTEPGAVQAYFLDAIPTGASVSVTTNRTNNAIASYTCVVALNALGACEPTGVVLLQNDGAYAEQSVDDGSPGTNSLRLAAGYYGGASPAPAGANSTSLITFDSTAFGLSFVRETTAGQGARLVGFTQATSDDRAATHFAVREVPAAGPRPGPPRVIGQAVQRSLTRCKGILVPDHKLWRPKLWTPNGEVAI